MKKYDQQEITRLLLAWGEGNELALEVLLPLVNDELWRVAARHLRRQNPGHLLQTTALVNEVYLRLIEMSRVGWQNRAHFLAVMANLTRRVLADDARQRQSWKRGGRAIHVPVEEVSLLIPARRTDLVAHDEALKVSRRTVRREWRLARLWLYQALNRGAANVA